MEDGFGHSEPISRLYQYEDSVGFPKFFCSGYGIGRGLKSHPTAALTVPYRHKIEHKERHLSRSLVRANPVVTVRLMGVGLF